MPKCVCGAGTVHQGPHTLIDFDRHVIVSGPRKESQITFFHTYHKIWLTTDIVRPVLNIMCAGNYNVTAFRLANYEAQRCSTNSEDLHSEG
jgi:hypothetical protein